MSTLAGLVNHQVTAGQALTGKSATPLTGSTTGTGSTSSSSTSSSDSATISANDFLTLLVTEMQNQDPTADTDPNEYINQLVQVNSLEQLIDINQTLSTDLGSTSSTSGSSASKQVAGASNSVNSASASASPLTKTSGVASSSASTSQASSTSGNLSSPTSNAAAQRVGHALTRRIHSATSGGIPLANQ
jgi:flagellar basal-body rod modification protein FlgD